jgi:hypothetical protein
MSNYHFVAAELVGPDPTTTRPRRPTDVLGDEPLWLRHPRGRG